MKQWERSPRGPEYLHPHEQGYETAKVNLMRGDKESVQRDISVISAVRPVNSEAKHLCCEVSQEVDVDGISEIMIPQIRAVQRSIPHK